MAQKCVVKMGDKLLPVDGSVQGTGVNITGTCPTCNTPGVQLSIVGGYIRAHVVAERETPENNPQPPTLAEAKGKKVGKGLSEPVTALVDTGLRTGDPKAAEQRRVVDLNGATGNGTVQVPRRVQSSGVTKSGKPRMVTKLVDVPGTEENVREALDYWLNRRSGTDASRAKQRTMVSLLTRWADAFRKAREADVLAGVTDAAEGHRGPTLVPGRSTAPRLRDPELSWDESTDLRRNGEVKKMTTLDQPRGRDRFDKKITDVPEPPRKRTAAERRRHRRQVAELVARQRNSGK